MIKSETYINVIQVSDKTDSREAIGNVVELLRCKRTRAQGYKTFFMLNSAENEICSAYKKLNTINLYFLPAQRD